MGIKQFLQYAAKAVAALVAPWVLVAVAWVTKAADIEVLIDPEQAEVYVSAAVLSVLQAVWVYFQRNKKTGDIQVR